MKKNKGKDPDLTETATELEGGRSFWCLIVKK